MPEVFVVDLQVQDSLLLSTSDTTVEGDNGGWVKEDRNNWDDIWGDVSTTPVNWDE
ncbi:MAG: hypothetical protein IJ209_05955 [Bacteroidaceae bacterium]|nr:hypothetical protein [Bacteroidaceae bacterium]